MNPVRERAAVIALLRAVGATGADLSARIETAPDIEALLSETSRDVQPALFGSGESGAEQLVADAAADIERWHEEGIAVLTVRDPDYPDNLREVHDRPPVLFVAGRLRDADALSVAVIGSRRASSDGRLAAGRFARDLVASGVVVVSGLAAGIDTAAHEAALAAGGRTVAVIGTGLRHSYPPQNAALQARLAREHAVVSQFWPDAPPRRDAFPARNATMSGLSRASVIIEAGERSGARVQARRALAHGRPVFLYAPVTVQAWARELAARPNVRVVSDAAEVVAVLRRLEAGDALEA